MEDLENIYYRVSLEDDGTGLIRTSLVNEPAIEEDFQLFDKVKIEKIITKDIKFEIFEGKEDERIITGPVMIPDKKILRKFSDGSGYYNCIFTKEDILNTVKKASKQNKFNQFNLNHSQLPEDMVSGVYLVESIILNERTRSEIYGDLPDGTWIASLWVEDKEYWDTVIKSGDFKGFSVEIKVSMETEEEIKEDMRKTIEKIINSNLTRVVKKEKIEKILNPEKTTISK